MKAARTNIVFASALSALVAVGASILALAIRDVLFGGVRVNDLYFAIGHFAIIAVLFVWPPLTAIAFLIGIMRVPDISTRQAVTTGRIGVAIGTALGSIGLTAFWLAVYDVSFPEALGWAIVGAGIGAFSGYLFDRLAFGSS